MATERPELKKVQLPLLEVDQDSILFEDFNSHRRDDCNYPEDEPDSNDIVASGPFNDDSFYLDWEEERFNSTYSKTYIDDETMRKLIPIIGGTGGYFQLCGASITKKLKGTSVSEGSSFKSKGQKEEIVDILSIAVGAEGTQSKEQLQEVNEIIEAMRKRFSGDKKRRKELEKEEVRLGIGRIALKDAA